MVKPVDSGLPAVFNLLRANKPIVVALAAAAIGLLLAQVVTKSLIGRMKPQTAEELRVQGCKDFNNQKFDQAIQKFTSALRCVLPAKKRSELFFHRAIVYAKKGDSDAALADFESVLNYDPTPDLLLQIYFYRGSVFADQKGSYEAAIADFDEALKLSSSDQEVSVKILVERARAHRSLGHDEQSLADLNAAFALNSQNPILRAKILAFRAQLKIYLKQTETILEDLKEALNCSDPKLRSFIYVLRGDYYLEETGDDALALHDYNEAIGCKRLDEETSANVVFKRGMAYANLKQRDDALTDFTQALQSSVSNDLKAQILNYRAMVYSERNEYQLAVDDLTQAIDLQPEGAQQRCVRASVYLNLKRFPESIDDLTVALELCPNDKEFQAEVLNLRGNVYQANQQPELARTDFKTALSYNPTKEGLREVLVKKLSSF